MPSIIYRGPAASQATREASTAQVAYASALAERDRLRAEKAVLDRWYDDLIERWWINRRRLDAARIEAEDATAVARIIRAA